MGFAGYFLIVADFINWAKRNDVPVGPGRGSGAGLAGRVLRSASPTSIRCATSLLFERFLNPERVSMPDFDIDFCQDGRDRVIDYVKQKYGADSVSQIATFGTMAAKAAVRDVGRVLDLPYAFVDGIAKLIPFQPGSTVTLRRAQGERESNASTHAKASRCSRSARQDEEEVRELLSLAEELEGLPRNVGMHAGGVLIAPGQAHRLLPALRAAGRRRRRCRSSTRTTSRRSGLVKFDFLGLTTLTILDWTLRYVRKLDPADARAPRRAAARRQARLRDLPHGQHDRRVPVRIARHARPAEARAADRFEDIIALVALYRPGPMELIPDYVERKHGRGSASTTSTRASSRSSGRPTASWCTRSR